MDQLLAYRNDLGMLAEEIDPKTGRHAGNTPQAFSHLALINAADAINRAAHGADQPRARTSAAEDGRRR
jgi:GH15 family glucan-1,4-alpha-glucosidase